MFEKEQDLKKELYGIICYTKLKGGEYKKLGRNDVDYKLLDKQGNIRGYAEVKVAEASIASCFPLNVPVRMVLKLIDKRLNPVIIWSCRDGIVYGIPQELTGEVKWSKELDDLEIKYNNKKQFKYVRF